MNGRVRKLLIFHPILISLFPILFLYARNIDEVPASDLIEPLVIVLLGSLVIWFIVSKFLKDYKVAAIITSIYSILFFSYGYFAGYLITVLVDYLYIHAVIANLATVAFWLFIYWLVLFVNRKIVINTSTLNIFLNAVSLFLFTFIVIDALEARPLLHSLDTQGSVLGNSPVTEEAGERNDGVDIYYLIFDRYGSNQVLSKYFNYDNSDFTDFLMQEGFYVAPDSDANYLKTVHSLTSSLNMDYLDYLVEHAGRNQESWKPVFDALENNQVQKFLKERGYKFYHFGSWWGQTSSNRYADVNINIYPLSDFSMTVYENTLFYPFGEMFGVFDGRMIQWERVNHKFEEIAKVVDDSSTTFVFAHFLVPHSPYVFDEDGEFLEKNVVDQRSFNENYINQVKYVNKRIKELIRRIKEGGVQKSAIIIQADEGPYPPRYLKDPYSLGTLELSEDELKEKMGILNAYYFSDEDYNLLYSSITPVNSFRIIFNKYFGTDLDIFPDRIYVFADYPNPFIFKDVTCRLRDEEACD